MGTWSDGIFGNDLACDFRAEYRERLAAGDDILAAVKRVRRAFADEMREGDGKRTVWIALAAAQVEKKAVSDDVRMHALKAIAWCEHPELEGRLLSLGCNVGPC